MDSPEKHEAVNAEQHTEHLEECTVEHTAELREILTETPSVFLSIRRN